MKRYYNNNNLDIDPIRSAWNNTNSNEFHKPINKLHDDIMINNITIKNTPSNYNQMNKPLNQTNNYVFESFSNQHYNQLLPKANKQVNVPPPSIHEQLNSKGPSYSLTKNNYHNMDDPSIQLLPHNNSDKNQPIISKNNFMNVTNYNNDRNRMNNIANELFQKDELIQKYKNEIYHLQLELNDVKKEQSQMISSDVENKLLKDKLNEQYELSRELNNVKHILKRTQLVNQGNHDTIDTLKNIIHKQYLQLNEKPIIKTKPIILSDSESESDISDSDDDYSDSLSDSEEEKPNKLQIKKKISFKKQEKNNPPPKQTKKIVKKEKKIIKKKNPPPPPKKTKIKPTSMGSGFSISNPYASSNKTYTTKPSIYQNDILKNALLKKNFTSKQIDDLIVNMKITQKTPVTKQLINIILQKMNR